MGIPYFMDGKAQKNKKTDGEKPMIKKIDLILDYMKKYNVTVISQKTAEKIIHNDYESARSILSKSGLFKCKNKQWRLLKQPENEGITMGKGKFVCGLDGCTKEVASAHQAKHALEEHNMDIREYKDARLAMKKGNYKGNYKKSDEEFKPSLIPETPEQDKTPESILKQKEEIDAQYEEPLREENPNPMITEESLKIVNEKQEAEDILTAQINKNIAAQNEKHKPKEIIEVVILRCPHCGGKLKMKE